MEQLKNVWFYLQPYVFISEDKSKYLLYNTQAKKGLLFNKNNAMGGIVGYIQNTDNMYSILIDLNDLKNKEIYEFIQKLLSEGYGDILEGTMSKPIIMPPILSLQNSVERLKENNLPVGSNILSYLHEVTIHINGECNQECDMCGNLHKQVMTCVKSGNYLEFDRLKSFLNSIVFSPASINITGGNPFLYPELYELYDIIGRMASRKRFIISYLNIPENLDTLYIFTNPSFLLKITVSGPFEKKILIDEAIRLKSFGVNQSWKICITSTFEYEKAEELSEEFMKNNIDLNIKPVYNGKNLSFFEQYVFIQQEDFLSSNLDKQDIFALQMLNTNDFGKLIILSNGKVYANINEKPIGMMDEAIMDILSQELDLGTSWRKTRYNSSTCHECCFKLICPSPSNYEMTIKRMNLCNLK